jgi:hypothetical protein
MMAECGITLAHTTILRWVQRATGKNGGGTEARGFGQGLRIPMVHRGA